MNIWHDISQKRITPERFIVCVEISKGSKKKYELDKETGMIILDRVLFTSAHYPANYGFIPRTYAGDNDPLDVLVLCQEDIEPMSLVDCYPIGVIKMIDSDEVDEKIIAIPFGDPSLTQYTDLKNLPHHLLSEISHFFEVYKSLEGKRTYILDIEGREEAVRVIEDAMTSYEKKFGKKEDWLTMGRAFEVRKESMMKTALAKSKLYAKYGKEIYMAAKAGVPDPELNVNLKRVIEKAKKDQVTSDVIKRAIDKAKGNSDENYYEIRYEGFGPGNSLIIVECLTDNNNRALTDVRTAFNKSGGKLGVSGSVMHQFEHVSAFLVESTEDKILEVLLENNLDVKNIESEGDEITIYAEPSQYAEVKNALKNAGIETKEDNITFLPLQSVEITSKEELEKFEKLIKTLEELDDVQNVYHNVK